MTPALQEPFPAGLPLDIRPLRPVVPGREADLAEAWASQPFPATRALLFAALGKYRAVPFSEWLAEVYWRGYWNTWPESGRSYGLVTRCPVCALPGSGETVGAVLRLALSVLAGGPARRFPESGEARFLAAAPGDRDAWTVQAADPGIAGAFFRKAAAETVPYASWLYAAGMARALSSAAADRDRSVRKLVTETCSPLEFYGKESEEKTWAKKTWAKKKDGTIL